MAVMATKHAFLRMSGRNFSHKINACTHTHRENDLSVAPVNHKIIHVGVLEKTKLNRELTSEINE